MSKLTTSIPYEHDKSYVPMHELDDILLDMVRASRQHHKQLGDSFARFLMAFDTHEETCLVFDTNHITPTIYTGSQCIARATGRERRRKHKSASASSHASASTSASTSEDEKNTSA